MNAMIWSTTLKWVELAVNLLKKKEQVNLKKIPTASPGESGKNHLW